MITNFITPSPGGFAVQAVKFCVGENPRLSQQGTLLIFHKKRSPCKKKMAVSETGFRFSLSFKDFALLGGWAQDRVESTDSKP
jgi:hypothetical protein